VSVDVLILKDVEELRRRLAPHVRLARRVVAFGSVARGKVDQWSDLDLLIVADTTRPFLERFKDFAGIYNVWPRVDLLIYTPAELDAMIAEENPLVLLALREGIVLHEAEPS
jgi:predicted nucleotidyltransferase